ncbi:MULTISPECIES: redoxin domain-containing protein [Halolamina]|uniref:redoxin domain-containing protein n=1 Tax=Halolamina TaxID=1075397 RepID=UPI00094420CC|nr:MULTISPECIES: peroxiredoxin [Halolamina]NHX36237.1 peroxiredoxin [Halolamina sp. R1-12]
MPAVGTDAPAFTAPVADDDGITPRPLDAYLDETPTVLAFFPAAFSGTCTTEFCTFRDSLGPLATEEATVLGISTDLPWALAEFRAAESLPFPLVADNDGSVCRAYGVRTKYEQLGIDGVARRSVFVVDANGTVTYRWLADDPGTEPDYGAVSAAVEAAGED